MNNSIPYLNIGLVDYNDLVIELVGSERVLWQSHVEQNVMKQVLLIDSSNQFYAKEICRTFEAKEYFKYTVITVPEMSQLVEVIKSIGRDYQAIELDSVTLVTATNCHKTYNQYAWRKVDEGFYVIGV
jgi:hypothetical protein